MNIIYADNSICHNSIDICTYAGYILRINCGKAEEGLKTAPDSECALNALTIDNPLEYAHLLGACFIYSVLDTILLLHKLFCMPKKAMQNAYLHKNFP